jgi:L-iditol 2-dehydrogenase
MTDRIWVNRELIVPVPQHFSPADVAMLEPLGVAIHAIDLAKIRLLERVTILGCGPIGLLILQVARVAGASEILAVDPLAHRRELASRLGASAVAPDVEGILDRTSGLGTSLVVEATNSPHGFRDAVRAARIGGRLVLVGIPDSDTYTLPAAEARRRGLTVKFSRRMGEVYARAIELVAQARVDVRSVITDEIGLDEAPDAFRDLAENEPGRVKTIIYPSARARSGRPARGRPPP